MELRLSFLTDAQKNHGSIAFDGSKLEARSRKVTVDRAADCKKIRPETHSLVAVQIFPTAQILFLLYLQFILGFQNEPYERP